MFPRKLLLIFVTILLAGCASKARTERASDPAPAVPLKQESLLAGQDGNAASGHDLIRFESVGKEGLSTGAVPMPQESKAATVTPLQALKQGLSIDVDALDANTRDQLIKQLKADGHAVQGQ